MTINTTGGAYIGGDVNAQTFVGSDLYNYYFIGLAPLVHDPTRRFRNFLNEYLGTLEHPVPFGGRQAQLDELHAWLNEPDAPPYYLMTAEAGRGKSALICRWMEELRQQREDVEVVFIPISIRFQTAAQDEVFAALAARLAKIYGEPPHPAVLPGAQWQGICESYLDRSPPAGKQLLIILDGLDEATGWSIGAGFFSTSPPAGLRVLVTARLRVGESTPEGWAATLGWHDHLTSMATLLPLTRTGLEEALASMGNPLETLANKTEIVQQLYRLTEGDPLLVRLYVQELEQQKASIGSLNTEDLKKMTPGLQGYFDQWWKGQKEQWRAQGSDPEKEEANLRLLLDALSSAFGPLTLDDLAHLHPELASSRLVRVLLQLMNRWVIGDGKQQGYSYSHPRLGYFFWEQLSSREQATWDGRFCAWGERVLAELNSDALEPKDAPRYLLQHYAAHLKRSHAPAEAFYALISNGWRMAWEVLDISYGGFLADVQMAWEKAKLAYLPEKVGKVVVLVQQIKAALCRASVASFNNNIPSLLLYHLVNSGLCTPVYLLAIAKLTPNELNRARILVAVADHISIDQITEVVNLAYTIENVNWRSDVINNLAVNLSEQQRKDLLGEKLLLAQSIRSKNPGYDYASIYKPDLPTDVPLEILQERLQNVRTLGWSVLRAIDLIRLAPLLPEFMLSEVLEITGKLHKEHYRGITISNIAPYLPEYLLPEALSIISGIDEGCVEGLSGLAPYLSTELRMQALDIARSISDGFDCAEAMAAIAQYMPEYERTLILKEALYAARKIGDEHKLTLTLEKLKSSLEDSYSQHLKRSYEEFVKELQNLSVSSRAALVENLITLMPFILALAGDEAPQAAEGIFHAIQEVCAWWP